MALLVRETPPKLFRITAYVKKDIAIKINRTIIFLRLHHALKSADGCLQNVVIGAE